MTGYATGAGASVTGYGPGPGRYSELQGMPQSLSSQSPAGHPIKTETVAADFGSSYGAYGRFCNICHSPLSRGKLQL